MTEKCGSVEPTRPRVTSRPQPMRVHEATTKKKPLARHAPYEPRKHQTRARTREGAPTRHNFKIDLKELIVIPNVADKLKSPPKNDKRLGPSKDTWCEFHKAFGHNLRNCLALRHQLNELVRDSFMKEYLEENEEAPTVRIYALNERGRGVNCLREVFEIFSKFNKIHCMNPEQKSG